jgi:hypothetical protein
MHIYLEYLLQLNQLLKLFYLGRQIFCSAMFKFRHSNVLCGITVISSIIHYSVAHNPQANYTY